MKKICLFLLFNATFICAKTAIAQKQDSIYRKVDDQAQYPGYEKRRVMINLLARNLCLTEEIVKKYEEGDEIQVVLEFIVEKNGNVSDISVLQPVEFNTSYIKQRLLKAYQSLPGKFDPGKRNDEAVRSAHMEIMRIEPASLPKCADQPSIEFYSGEFQTEMDTKTVGFRNYTTHAVTLYVKYIDPQTKQLKTDKISMKAGTVSKEKDPSTNLYKIKPEEIRISFLNKKQFLFNFYNGSKYAIGDSNEDVYISEAGKTLKYAWLIVGYINIYDDRYNNTY